MKLKREVDYEEPVQEPETGELTDEEVGEVVGGLDRAWWPDPSAPFEQPPDLA